MPCFHPIQAWPAGPGKDRGVVFDPRNSYAGSIAYELPCGKCIGCRVAKARSWAVRMAHEASLSPDNSFVTLTYEDAQLPSDGSVSVRATQLFVKRLRKAVALRSSATFRYFAVGEYGDKNWRPHYHLVLFGWFPDDAALWRISPRGDRLWRSPLLERAWPFGHSEVGTVTAKSAGYVARYALKKMTGDPAVTHYCRPHPVTGQFFRVAPEFAVMSRRPGIGAGWIDQFPSDVFPDDFVVVDGKRYPVPAYYKRALDERSALKLRAERMSLLRATASDRTRERLAVREESLERRADLLKRELESDS